MIKRTSSTTMKEHALSKMQMLYIQSHWCKQFLTCH